MPAAIPIGAAVAGGVASAAASKMMSGKGGQTTAGTNAPWSAQQPYLEKGFQAAGDLYDKGGPVYAPMSINSEVALDKLWNRGYAGSPTVDRAKVYANNVFNNQTKPTQHFADTIGLSYTDNPASGLFKQQMGLNYADNPGSSYFGGAQGGQFLNSNPVNKYLGSTASGGMLNNNPYLDATYDKAAKAVNRNFSETVNPGIDSAFERGGRYGSGLYQNSKDQAQENYVQGLGDLATNIYGGNYANERQNQLTAANTIGNAYAGERQLQQGAANNLSDIYQGTQSLKQQAGGALSGIYNQAADRSDRAASQLNDMKLRVAGLAPSLDNQSYTDLGQLANVGKTIEGYQQQQLDSPYTALQRYQQSISGNYGGQSTITQPGQSPWGSIGQIGGSLLNQYMNRGGSGSGSSYGNGLYSSPQAAGFGQGTTVYDMPWLSGGGQ